MQSIILPGTDLVCSRLGYGTASLHHGLRSRARQALLTAALDTGFTHFDTARMYGEGMAERELGRFLVGRRQEVTIATKFGMPAIGAFEWMPPLLYAHRALGSIGRRLFPVRWDRRPRSVTPKAAESSLTRSLRALRTDWVDLLLLHEPLASEVESVLGLSEWLRLQKASGRVRYLGLAGNAAECVAVARRTDELFDVLQVEDSLSGREADVVTGAGRPLQITFGYLRQASADLEASDPLAIVRGALTRNPQGMVLVSTRRRERLAQLAAAAEPASSVDRVR
jgi:aryl-alcohol dehydrogenase-like predicted oxidoreductase